jgi:hypothetical protein
MEIRKLININETAHLLCLTKRQVKSFVRDNKIPHVVLPNGEVRFDEADLWAWSSALKKGASTDE